MGYSEQQKANLRKLLDRYDTSKDGSLTFDEFLNFLKALPNADLSDDNFNADEVQESDNGLNLRQIRFLYDGMDLDGSHSLSDEEIIHYLEATQAQDFKYITKLIFRGADKDRSRKVSIAEIKDAVTGLGSGNFDEASFQEKCKLELGEKKKELEYWEFYKIITGETLDSKSVDADPYEGKLPEEKSKCCLLL